MSARSYLYVPGDSDPMLAKAAERGADALILDLEDAVPPARKDAARAAVTAWLRAHGGRIPTWVRVNRAPAGDDDLRAAAGVGAAGIVLPKVSSAADIEHAVGVMGEDRLPICALIETASGILDARAIASADGVVRLAIGEADLGAELGIVPSEDGREMLALRTTVVLASAAAGIEQPVAPISNDFRDLDSMRRTTHELRRQGFGARAAIHPAQVPVINDAFTPSEAETDAARRLLARFEAAGGGVVVDDDGRMIDEAHVRAARRILVRAEPD